MVTVAQWVHGARPRTLPAAVSPVAAGTGVAAFYGQTDAASASLALVVALALQVGVNYANDYSDGVRGTDDARVGPLRLTASGVATPAAVRTAALVSFAVAAVAGVAVVVRTEQWWLLLVGAASIGAAWYYTGGRTPYGYRGLGEASVFVFFGVVATAGTAYVQLLAWSWFALVVGCGVGALACALLVVNNLRDLPTDAASGKRTVAVRLGDAHTRVLYLVLVAASLVVVVTSAIIWTPWALVALAAYVPVAPPVGAVASGASGPALVAVLQSTGLVALLYGVLFGIGLSLS